MRLSIIIPVYNEKNSILEILKRVKNVKLDLEREIIIVDDFSTDGTRDILDKLNDDRMRIFFHNRNLGKGAAIRTGLKYTKGDIILIQDADLEYDPNDYPKLIKPILSKKTKVVYGSRFLREKLISRRNWAIPSHYLGNKVLSMTTTLLFGRYISDMETCYKVFTKEVVKEITLYSDKFDIEPEITAKLLKKGYKILEVPIKYNSRGYKDGKKINWVDGLHAIKTLIRYRFSD